jgi:hypothetical protein
MTVRIVLESITRWKEAANSLIKFFDDAVVIADRYKTNPQSLDAENDYVAMLDKIKPTVLVYADVDSRLACEMGMDAFFNHEERTAIHKVIVKKSMELYGRIPVFPLDT